MLTIPLSQDGLMLREFVPADAAPITQMALHPDFSFYALATAQDGLEAVAQTARALVDKAITLQAPCAITGQRENYKLAIAPTDDPDRCIGYFAFDEWNEAHGEERDIGYFVDPQYQRRGIATAASFLFMNRFFDVAPYDQVWATVHPDNTASRKVLDKLGFQVVNQKTKLVRGIVEPRLVLCVRRHDLRRPHAPSLP